MAEKKDNFLEGIIPPPFSTVTNSINRNNVSNDSILSSFFETMVMSGADHTEEHIYSLAYNSLHRLDYFNPHVASGIHIFMTRPMCAFTANNIGMHSTVAMAANSLEGCISLASLMPPDPSDLLPVGGEAELLPKNYDNGYGTELWENVKTYGLNKLRRTPFIPIISNLSDSISGMRDFIMEKYDYDGDQAGNKTSDAKGMDESSSSGEVTLSFSETSNIAITMLHYFWMIYMDYSGKGLMVPCSKSLEYLFYDYMSSIYWFVTGPDGFSIKVYGKLTGLFPINLPITSLVPSKRGTPTDPNISITYHYNHSEIMNPEIIRDFNFTIDAMKKLAPTERLENDVVPSLNDKLEAWKRNNWVISWDSFQSGSTAAKNRNDKYNRFMPTGKSLSGKDTYDIPVFYPDPSNQWSGHPYIWDGKLIYTTI
jgi:hypothetical protein